MREGSTVGWVRAAVAGLVVAAGLAATLIIVGRNGGASTADASRHDGTAMSTPSGAGLGGPSGGPGANGHGGSPGAPGAAGSTPAGGAAGGQAAGTPSAGASWFTVSLGSACVVPGGTQTLAAHSRPGYTVAFNSRYADGKSGDTYGGFGVLPTDASGTVTSHWTVAATAPLGTVTLGAGTANGGPATTLTRTFTVAAHC